MEIIVNCIRLMRRIKYIRLEEMGIRGFEIVEIGVKMAIAQKVNKSK